MCWDEVSVLFHFQGRGRGKGLMRDSLAYAELYLSLAAVVRRFRSKLFETDAEDVEGFCDAVMPLPKVESKGVRVRVF